MTRIITACLLFLIAAGWFILSLRAFLEKGPLLNNAYLYASRDERAQMDKKPHYRQSAIVFLLLGCFFLLDGLAFLLHIGWLYWLAGAAIAAAVVYAIVSGVRIAKAQK